MTKFPVSTNNNIHQIMWNFYGNFFGQIKKFLVKVFFTFFIKITPFIGFINFT